MADGNVMRELAVMTQSEIAAAMGIDRSMVSQIERRALRKFKAALAADPVIAEYLATETKVAT